nr:response regulator [Bacteriovorax sp. HI3]
MNILLVDDDQDIADHIIVGLNGFGYTVEHVLSGERVLELIKKNTYDLVLLDWNMPGMTGLDVLAEIRDSYLPSELPVIMVTSMNETEKIVYALDQGCNDYITKPITIETVAARVKTQITLQKLHEQHTAKNKLEVINEVVTTLNHEINNPLFIALNHIRKANRRADYTQLEKAENALVRITNIVKQISDLNTQSKKILKKDKVVHLNKAA